MRVSVWRLEERDSGRGIYAANHFVAAGGGNSSFNQPAPWEDMKLAPVWSTIPCSARADYRFGFDSIEQMLKWTESEDVRANLAKRDVVLRRYEVQEDQVIVGDRQAIFMKACARIIETLCPTFVDKSRVMTQAEFDFVF